MYAQESGRVDALNRKLADEKDILESTEGTVKP